jgi:hypothetical protein
MLDKENFKQRVFEKYEENSKKINDDFYNVHFYTQKKIRFNLLKKYLISNLIPIIVTVGTVYAGVATVNYFKQKSKTDFENNIDYDYSQDMNYQDKIYHKVISSYDDYEKAKEKWNNLVSMNSEDFNEYFILVIAVENTSLIGLDVSNITSDTDNLYVELYQSDKFTNTEESVISVKISREQLRENIKFNITGLQPQDDKYISINEISKDYSKEQAIKDGCFVIENNEIMSSNTNQIIDFVENKSSKFIRIVDFEQETIITDIEYKDNKYYINRLYLDTGKTVYKIGKDIIISKPKNLDHYLVFSQDEYTNQYHICSIKY